MVPRIFRIILVFLALQSENTKARELLGQIPEK